MTANDKQTEFEQWSASYDREVVDDGSFPFDGYRRILDRVVELAAIEPGMAILELGPGTGNLTRRLIGAGAAVWGLDFSTGMLGLARKKVPEAHGRKKAGLPEGNRLSQLYQLSATATQLRAVGGRAQYSCCHWLQDRAH